MKKLVSGLVVSLGLSCILNADNLKMDISVINYSINNNNVCEKLPKQSKDLIFKSFNDGITKIERIIPSSLGTTTLLEIANGKNKQELIMFDNYGECEFFKAFINKKVTENDKPKYIGMPDPKIKAEFIRDNVKKVVNDTKTGLMWQDDSVGKVMNWDTAITTCENLTLAGYNDWRLPNKKEIESIVDVNKAPTLPSAFISFASYSYWSSSIDTNNDSNAWIMGFDFGFSATAPKFDGNYVRCVRTK